MTTMEGDGNQDDIEKQKRARYPVGQEFYFTVNVQRKFEMQLHDNQKKLVGILYVDPSNGKVEFDGLHGKSAQVFFKCLENQFIDFLEKKKRNQN